MAWLATLVPGPDTAVVVRNAVVKGRVFPPAARLGYREGVLVNALNPKTALFMSALLPQFVTPDSPWWLPGALVVVTAFVSFRWMSGYALLFATFGDVLRRPRVRRLLDGLMGTVLIGFGARLAASPQPWD